MNSSSTVVVLGGSGFIGKATIASAVASGHRVVALARSDRSAEAVQDLGAEPLHGDTAAPEHWMGHCAGADAIVDLTQPAIPKRLTARALGKMAGERVGATKAMLAALADLPPDRRPLWVSVSGTDDLLPDQSGRLSGSSGLRQTRRGFGRIGLPVRSVVVASGAAAVYVHFGQMVYGPGKAFADLVVEGLRTGRAVVIGSGGNHLPLTHVDDAAASLSHLAGLQRNAVVGRTVVAAPPVSPTQRDLYVAAAEALGRPLPKRVPAPLAAVVAGRVSVEVMTVDAHCLPDLLTDTGFVFRHETIATGIPHTLEAMGVTGSSLR